MIYLLHVALAVVAFLLMLNSFLRGSAKARIDSVLSMLLLGLLVAVAVTAGLLATVVALGLTVVYATVSRPLAARAASSLLSIGRPGSRVTVGLPDRELGRISRELGRERSSKEILRDLTEGSSRRDEALNALVAYCRAHNDVSDVMAEYSASDADLRELYTTLLAGAMVKSCGLG